MTRTEYFLEKLVKLCGQTVCLAMEAKSGNKRSAGQLVIVSAEYAAAMEGLVKENLFEETWTEEGFDKAVQGYLGSLNRDYEIYEARHKTKEAMYLLKEAPVTDLPTFYKELREQFPDISKRKPLRVYESEKTEPFMDLMHAHAMVLQEVKT